MSLPSSESEILLIHNPRCSKSRATKALLEERGAEFSVREYLEDPLDEVELAALAKRLGKPISDWIRKGESAYEDAGLSDSSGEASMLAAVAAAPILMQRPIVVCGQRAAIGRPPEDILGLLG